jgi:competence protein ComEC
LTIVARLSVAAAVGAWSGVGQWWWFPLVVVGAAAVRSGWMTRPERLVVLVFFAAGAAVGVAHAQPPEPLAQGPVLFQGRVVVELGSRWGWSGLVKGPEATVLVRAPAAPADVYVRVVGDSDGRVQEIAGRWVAATVTAERIEQGRAPSVHAGTADAMRRRIVRFVQPERGDARGLLVGFLIGDISAVSPVVYDDMKRTGLSHLVAVSGSNVAVFLVGLVIVTAPLAMLPSVRLLIVLNGLLVFGVLTRWEPSVVRASAMAAVVGIGRFVGVPLEPVTALAAVAAGSVLIDPGLSRSLGFQLSVLATGGLVFGSRWWPGGGRLARILKATLAAQAAVAPLLLAVFGSVPLLSPVANVVAIPLVSSATILGGVGAGLGASWLVTIAAFLAEAVMFVARVAAPWPQLGWPGFALMIVIGLVWWRRPRVAALLAPIGAVALVASMVPAGSAPDSGVLFLDVGQGDSIVVRMSGVTVLVDGGPDPVRLADRLRRHGIRSIDLVVVTHVHADHVAGITGVLGRIPVGRIWTAFEPHVTPSSTALLGAATTFDVRVDRPTVGDRVVVGHDSIEVIGPRRRYAGANDQSIVLLAVVDGVRVLLAADIETVAQAELEVGGVDVLKVPHQGAATSDPGWLAMHAGRVAVITVGANDFGHPSPGVVDLLDRAGADVYRTDVHGDIVITVESGVMLVETSHQR